MEGCDWTDELANVAIEVDGSIAQLRIDRPEHGNRLDGTTVSELAQTVHRLDADDSIAIVVLGAHGPDFCLGRDPRPGALTPSRLREEFDAIQGLNDAVTSCRAITIAAIRGRASGAGLSLAGRCDLVAVSRSATLSFPEVPHGIPPTIVLSHYRYVLPPKLLADLILTGRELDGAEAKAVGLASHVVEDGDVDDFAHNLALQITEHGIRTLRSVKEFLVQTRGMDPRDAPRLGISTYINEIVDRHVAD